MKKSKRKEKASIGYVICDNTASNGKIYIDEDGNNTRNVEIAKWYDTEREAKEVIEDKGWGDWAYVSKEEDTYSVDRRYENGGSTKGKLAELKQTVADMKEVIAATTDEREKKVLSDALIEAEKELAVEEKKEKSTKPDAKLEKTAKKSVKKIKMEKIGKSRTYARPEKKVVKTKEKDEHKPDCHELAALWEKRKKAAKESAGKKTAPIMKRAAESMEKIVRSGIQYNKDNGGSLKVEKLKKAVTAMEEALDAFKSALNGKFEDLYIKKFKSDMKEVIKAAEKASNE